MSLEFNAPAGTFHRTGTPDGAFGTDPDVTSVVGDELLPHQTSKSYRSVPPSGSEDCAVSVGVNDEVNTGDAHCAAHGCTPRPAGCPGGVL